MVGWILIEDTNIDYPVMQTPTDPTYYLKHDFEKNYTDYGCPFMQAGTVSLAYVAELTCPEITEDLYDELQEWEESLL